MAKKDGDTIHDRQTVIDAIRGEGRWEQPGKVTTSSGIVTEVARRLGVSRNTVYFYKNKWQTVADALEDEREAPLDLAENKLYAEVNNGNITAIIFLLKTRGKARGYVERQEITGADGKDFKPAVYITENRPADD